MRGCSSDTETDLLPGGPPSPGSLRLSKVGSLQKAAKAERHQARELEN